jgi:HD-like signal output (HDOD) protein/CheY-like chemotaxis protein
MTKRLLFVDDDPLVLDGLRRALHGMRQSWEMNFVSNAEAALDALEKDRYDAVVSDMRMPLMDGAQLLEQIKQRYPDIVRMILSGQSNREAVYRSIAPAHQFLSKPCDPQELTLRLGQAFAMRDLLANQSVKTAISRLRSIPSLPTLYDEITAALRLESPSLDQIARIISKDVGMAAKILQLSNSAFVGASGRVSSLVHALSLIGTETVRTLVLSVHVFSQFDGKPQTRAGLTALWEHSVVVSSLAQRIAGCEGRAKAMVEQSFTAGLLHDIGKVVLLAEMPREYHEIFEAQPAANKNLERERLGCTHAEVGAYLMSIWGLPFSLVHAVAFHHHPSESTETEFSCLTAVHAANAIAGATDASPLNHDVEIDMNYLDRLRLQGREPVWRGLHQPAASSPSANPEKQPKTV